MIYADAPMKYTAPKVALATSTISTLTLLGDTPSAAEPGGAQLMLAARGAWAVTARQRGRPAGAATPFDFVETPAMRSAAASADGGAVRLRTNRHRRRRCQAVDWRIGTAPPCWLTTASPSSPTRRGAGTTNARRRGWHRKPSLGRSGRCDGALICGWRTAARGVPSRAPGFLVGAGARCERAMVRDAGVLQRAGRGICHGADLALPRSRTTLRVEQTMLRAKDNNPFRSSR